MAVTAGGNMEEFYMSCTNPECGHKAVSALDADCDECGAAMEPDDVEPEDSD